jgi:hypothetical protein
MFAQDRVRISGKEFYLGKYGTARLSAAERISTCVSPKRVNSIVLGDLMRHASVATTGKYDGGINAR